MSQLTLMHKNALRAISIYGPHRSDIVKANVVKERSLPHFITTLEEAGYITRPRRGEYVLTDKGQRAISGLVTEAEQPNYPSTVDRIAEVIGPILIEHQKYRDTLYEIRNLIDQALGE